MQEQLALIFEDAAVREQLQQDINDFCKQPNMIKLLVVEILYLADQQFIVKVRLNSTFVQLFAEELQKQEEQQLVVRLVFPREYPEAPPRMYFESEELNQRYTVPGRDYFHVLWNVPWKQRFHTVDLLPKLVGFLSSCEAISYPQALGQYHRGEFFDYLCFVDRQSCEFFPVLVVLEDGNTIERYLVLHRYDMLLLEPTNIPNYLRLVDCYSLRSVSMVMSHRQDTQRRLLLSIKLARFQALLELFSDYCPAIAQSLIERKIKLPAENSLSSSWKFQPIESQPTNRQQFDLAIRQREQLLAKKPCEQTTAALIRLCNKAIEYCTTISGDNHEPYLQKLQRLMSIRGSQVAQPPSIFADCQEPEKETFHDKLHDISQVTSASCDMFELA